MTVLACNKFFLVLVSFFQFCFCFWFCFYFRFYFNFLFFMFFRYGSYWRQQISVVHKKINGSKYGKKITICLGHLLFQKYMKYGISIWNKRIVSTRCKWIMQRYVLDCCSKIGISLWIVMMLTIHKTAGKGRGLFLFISTTFPNSQTFTHLFAVLYLRWLPHAFYLKHM